ncbi:MAG: NAD(P)-dependent oxidoreductase [Candidatus Heimdallarchaeota archaeon]|nr:NAD(P)-dependent oxidoreductase [Candidatus Heimdallarchaeota archaeon]
MKVLLTGPFGNVGESTLSILLERGYDVRCFDKRTKQTKKVQKIMSQKGDFETIWGDIRNKEDVQKIVQGVEYIIHLCAIIPPEADEQPDYADAVNAGGMKNLVEAVEKLDKKPRIIFTSSLAIYGSKMHIPPPRMVTDEIEPISHDLYAFQKWEMEKILQASSLDWMILRLTAVPSLRMPMKIPSLMFEVPFDQRLEFIHSRDAGLACVNAIDAFKNHKIMNLAGGENCQMLAGEYITRLLKSFGVGPIPRECFHEPKHEKDWFHTDWLYTEDTQELLKFQRYTLEDFAQEFENRIKLRRKLIRIVSPLAQLFLILRSPYYRQNKK